MRIHYYSLVRNSITLLFTGHLLDHASRLEPRFPFELLEEARAVLRSEIERIIISHEPAIAICSLAAGGDMIFAEEMILLKIPLVIFLPFEVEEFLKLSVTYDKGRSNEPPSHWAVNFQKIIRQAQLVIITGTNNVPQEEALTLCNEKMLAHALEQSGGNPQKVLALALIKSADEIKRGGSSEFVKLIKAHGVAVKKIWPQPDGHTIDKVNDLEELIPPFAAFETNAVDNQRRWKSRFHFSLAVLGMIAFFDAFVTVPDHFLFGYGKEARIFSLISSVIGAFVTLRLQVSEKSRYRNWTENRAKVEQMRSEIWYFLFDLWSENNRQGSYTLPELEAYIKRLDKSGNRALINEKLLQELKTCAEKMTIAQKINNYRHLRLQNQISYFIVRSERFTAQLRRYKRWTLFFLVFSVGWGALKMMSEFYTMPRIFSDLSPLGMMISFIALVSTYVEANNMTEMEFKYNQMVDVLQALSKEADNINSRATFDSWVKECEVFLRTQNNEWSLKREK